MRRPELCRLACALLWWTLECRVGLAFRSDAGGSVGSCKGKSGAYCKRENDGAEQ